MIKGKTVICISGSNFWSTAKNLDFDIDYKKLTAYFKKRYETIVRVMYFTTTTDDQAYSSIKPLIDWLDYNGYTVVTKTVKSFTDQNGNKKTKGNMDIELCVAAMELAPKVDNVVLFTGDGDFVSMVKAVQRMGCRVEIFSSIEVKPPMIADELRRAADEFVDIDFIADDIMRDEKDREQARKTREAKKQEFESEEELETQP